MSPERESLALKDAIRALACPEMHLHPETRDSGYRGKRCREEQRMLFSWLGQAGPCSQVGKTLLQGRQHSPKLM